MVFVADPYQQDVFVKHNASWHNKVQNDLDLMTC